MAEVGRPLSEQRLLTPDGPGGSGKARLALAVGAGVLAASGRGYSSHYVHQASYLVVHRPLPQEIGTPKRHP